MRSLSSHSWTSESGWIRLHDSISQETKTIHIISSLNSTLSMPIKIYLRSSFSPLSNEALFTNRKSHWTIGSSLKSVTLSQEVPGIYDIPDLFSFFSVITIFDVTLFCIDFNNSRFSYSNVIILLINSLSLCRIFPSVVYTVFKLGHRITYGNYEAVSTTKQSNVSMFSSTLMFFLHCMMNILRQMKKIIVELMNGLLFNTITQLVW